MFVAGRNNVSAWCWLCYLYVGCMQSSTRFFHSPTNAPLSFPRPLPLKRRTYCQKTTKSTPTSSLEKQSEEENLPLRAVAGATLALAARPTRGAVLVAAPEAERGREEAAAVAQREEEGEAWRLLLGRGV